MSDDSLKQKTAGRVYFLCWLAYTCSYFGRHNFSAVIASIVGEGLMTRTQCGAIGTVFFVVYGCGQLINGFLSDRFSPYKMIFAGTLISGLANAAMSFAFHPVYAGIVWGINGFAQSMLWAPIIYILSNTFTGEKLAKFEIGLSATIPCGTLAAYGLSTLSLRFLSWRYSFSVAGIVLVAMSAAWGINALSMGKEDRKISTVVKKVGEEKAPFVKIAVMSGIIMLAPSVMLHATLKDGVMTWVPTMISEVFKVSPSFSVSLSLILPIINFFGSIIASKLYGKAKISEAKLSAIFFAFTCFPLIGLMFISRLSPLVSVTLLALITSSMYAVNYIFLTLVPVSYAPYGRAATFAGVLDAVAYSGSALSSYGFGSLADTLGWNKTIYVWLGIAVLALAFSLISVKKWEKFKRDTEKKQA